MASPRAPAPTPVYANLELNYLRQRLETFTGVCFLTTNHEGAIDEACRRRLAFRRIAPTAPVAQP